MLFWYIPVVRVYALRGSPFKPAARLAFIAVMLCALVGAPDARADPRCGPEQPLSFAAEIKLIHQLAACGPQAAVISRRTQKVVRRHCARLRPLLASHRKRWLRRAVPFFRAHVPPDLPRQVVYPIGGADLFTLLATFPAATDYTSISLERSGDPRRVGRQSARQLRASLTRLRAALRPFFRHAHHRTDRLRRLERSALPAELGTAVVALALHGHAPVELRYFAFHADGSLRYITAEDLNSTHGRGALRAQRRLFANMELTFRTPDGALKRYRHVARDLSDRALPTEARLLRHLRAKGRVAALVKAGSYLIAQEGFSTFRGYMLDNLAWMLADSTGPSPRQARRAGLEVLFFGKYRGAYLPLGEPFNRQYRRLIRAQPRRPLRFRFGYPDSSGKGYNHLLIIRPRAAAPAPASAPVAAPDAAVHDSP